MLACKSLQATDLHYKRHADGDLRDIIGSTLSRFQSPPAQFIRPLVTACTVRTVPHLLDYLMDLVA